MLDNYSNLEITVKKTVISFFLYKKFILLLSFSV